MKFTAFSSLVTAAFMAGAALADKYPWERLDKNKAVLLVVDIQEGLFQLARDWDPTVYRQAAIAHAAIGNAFNLPVIMTTSAETGPNGIIPQEITEMYPKAPLIQRRGEVNAWDNEEFRNALKATNRTQVILGGIVTDVCTAFLARSLRAEGYSVWANLEASGTLYPAIRDITNQQLLIAGVNVVSMFAIVGDLMRDWRHVPGGSELLAWLDKYLPVFGIQARFHKNAILNGTLLPGQEKLPL